MTFDKTGTRRFRVRDIAAAIVALAIPTLATIFASDVEAWPAWPKVLLSLVWVACAAVLAVDNRRRDDRRDQALDDVASALFPEPDTPAAQRRDLRIESIDLAFRNIFAPDFEFPRKWSWTVFLFDSEVDLLVPIWPTPDADDTTMLAVKSFSPGVGATGMAWSEVSTISRTGPVVHDGTYGLTAAQQTRYASRNSVVATPVFTEYGTAVGVLAGVADDEDDRFDQPRDRAHLESVATSIGTLLTALLPDDLQEK